MIIVVDGTNRHKYSILLDQMFKLRARVFGGRLGWDVNVEDGREIDQFDALDPAYVIGVNDAGQVVSCVRALQTTGPHMLADVFSDILCGEPPLRSARLWESTRFCVDTQILERGKSRNSVSYATCELMAASLEYAKDSGIDDIVTVIDPVMNRVLQRSDCAPYDYVGQTVPMGKVPAMAALLDCTDERIEKLRKFAGIETDVFAPASVMEALSDARIEASVTPLAAVQTTVDEVKQTHSRTHQDLLEEYCREQVESAQSPAEMMAARKLADRLNSAGLIGAPSTVIARAG